MTYGKLEGFLLPEKGEIVMYEMKCLAMVYDVKNNWKPPYKYKKSPRRPSEAVTLLRPALGAIIKSRFNLSVLLIFSFPPKKVILNFPTVKL